MLNNSGLDVRVGDSQGTLLTEYGKAALYPYRDSHIVVPTGGVFTVIVRLSPEFTWNSADALRIILKCHYGSDDGYGFSGELLLRKTQFVAGRNGYSDVLIKRFPCHIGGRYGLVELCMRPMLVSESADPCSYSDSSPAKLHAKIVVEVQRIKFQPLVAPVKSQCNVRNAMLGPFSSTLAARHYLTHYIRYVADTL
jgi:hypothetical protein